MTEILRLLRTGSLTIAWILVLPCLLLLLLAVFPIVPWARIYAAGVVPNHVPWLLVWSFVALAIGMAAHSRRRTGITLPLVITASFSILLATGVMVHLLYVAESNGAQIDLYRTLSLRQYSDEAGPDFSRIYSRPEGEPLWLDVYRPPEAVRGKASPVMFVVHGGGFVEGSRKVGAANMRGYADAGWTVISIDYRLARADRPTWDLAILDVRCALAWTAANAVAMKLDLTRLTLTGASAGGSLAMTAAYGGATEAADPKCGPRIPRPAAVVVKAPLIDPLGSWENPGEMQTLQRQYLSTYLGGGPERFPQRYASVDLRPYAGKSNPPTLILAGTSDPLVPRSGAIDFSRKAVAAGNEVKLILFPYSGHDFNTTYGSIANQAVVQSIAHFMIRHGVGPDAR